MALNPDALHAAVLKVLEANPAQRMEVETIGESTFYGFARNQGADTANPVWLIARVTESGSLGQLLWASEEYDQIYDNKTSLFANPPFANENSILFGRNDGNDKLILADNPAINFIASSAFSVSVWFRTNSGAQQSMFSKQGTGNNPGYRIQTNSGRVEFLMYGTGGPGDRIEVRSTRSDLNDDNWHHVVFIKAPGASAANVSFYIDGVLGTPVIQQNSLVGSPSNTDVGQISGRGNTNTNTMSGFLDEVAVWNTNLSGAQALALWNSGNGPSSLSVHSANANLIGWWRMGDNDTFPTITNLGSVGAALNGTMVDMKASDIVGETP